MSIVMAVQVQSNNGSGSSTTRNVVDYIASIILFALASTNLVAHTVTASLSRQIGVWVGDGGARAAAAASAATVMSVNDHDSNFPKMWKWKQRVHITVSNVVSNVCFIICWTYILLYLDTCFMSVAGSGERKRISPNQYCLGKTGVVGLRHLYIRRTRTVWEGGP